MRSETDPAKQSYGLMARGKRVDRVRKARGGARNKSGAPHELPRQSGRRIASGAMPVGYGIAAGAMGSRLHFSHSTSLALALVVISKGHCEDVTRLLP